VPLRVPGVCVALRLNRRARRASHDKTGRVVDDRLAEICHRFERLGVSEEFAAAAHELESGGGLATATLLALCWHRLINSYDRPGALSRMPVAHRLANAGASLQDPAAVCATHRLRNPVRFVLSASEGPNHALRETLGIVDGGYPGWLLVEVDSNGEPTGRSIDDVYVGLRTSDPSGRQGHDIFED